MNETIRPLANGDFMVEGQGMADGREASPYEQVSAPRPTVAAIAGTAYTTFAKLAQKLPRL